MRRLIVLVSATLVGVAMLTGVAQAKPVTLTIHEHQAVDTFTDVIPCIGNGQELGTITTVENGVLHITAAGLDENGEPIPPYHITGTFTGTVTAVPDDPSATRRPSTTPTPSRSSRPAATARRSSSTTPSMSP